MLRRGLVVQSLSGYRRRHLQYDNQGFGIAQHGAHAYIRRFSAWYLRHRRRWHHQQRDLQRGGVLQTGLGTSAHRPLEVEHNSRRRGRTHSKAECCQLAGK